MSLALALVAGGVGFIVGGILGFVYGAARYTEEEGEGDVSASAGAASARTEDRLE